MKTAKPHPPVHCNRCNKDVEADISTSGPHLRADCPLCGAYIKFLKKPAALKPKLKKRRGNDMFDRRNPTRMQGGKFQKQLY